MPNNNYGASNAGRVQYNAALNVKNLLKLNDILSLNYNFDNNINKINRYSGGGVSYSLVVGRFGANAGISKSNSKQYLTTGEEIYTQEYMGTPENHLS